MTKSEKEIALELEIEGLQAKLETERALRARDEAEKKQDLQRKALIMIAEKSNQLDALIKEIETIAEEAGVPFTYSIDYGMGGTFYPHSAPDYSNRTGWVSSSAQC